MYLDSRKSSKVKKGITASIVDFPKKTVRITYQPENVTLKELVLLLSSIGYEPYISLENYEGGKNESIGALSIN